MTDEPTLTEDEQDLVEELLELIDDSQLPFHLIYRVLATVRREVVRTEEESREKGGQRCLS